MGKPITGHLAFCIAAKKIQCSSIEKKCLLLYYAIRADEHGGFFDSNFNITAETGVSDSTITRSNQAWSRLGLLTVRQPAKDSNHANSYQLHLPAWEAYAAKFNLEDAATRLRIEHQIKEKERKREWRDKKRQADTQRPTVTQRLNAAIKG